MGKTFHLTDRLLYEAGYCSSHLKLWILAQCAEVETGVSLNTSFRGEVSGVSQESFRLNSEPLTSAAEDHDSIVSGRSCQEILLLMLSSGKTVSSPLLSCAFAHMLYTLNTYKSILIKPNLYAGLADISIYGCWRKIT